MEPFKVTDKLSIFPVGIICSWSILIFLAVICIPYLANHVTVVKADNSSASFDGSGHGLLADMLGFFDDDSSDDNVDERNLEDSGHVFDNDGEGRNGTTVGGSEMITEMKEGELPNLLYIPKVMCYHCHGDGLNGCNIAAMLFDMQTFSVSCRGKCLNVSSGLHSVYDCAHDMFINTDKCFQNADTTMCFCTGDFCNGPPDVSEPNPGIKMSVLSPDQHLSHDDNNLDYNITQRKDTTSLKINDKQATKSDNFKTNSSIDFQETANSEQDSPHSIDYELFSENFTHFQEINVKFENSDKHDVNFVIPVNISGVYGDRTSQTAGPPWVVDVHDLRVGNLKDGSLGTHSGDSSSCLDVPRIVLSIMFNVFFMKCVV